MKTVKGWAVVTRRGDPQAVFLGWEEYSATNDRNALNGEDGDERDKPYRLVPATITMEEN